MHRPILALTLIASAACQPVTTELTEERQAEIVEEVRAVNAAYWDAWREADWDRGMAFYLDSPDFVWASGGAVFYGLAALEDTRPRFASVASQTYAFRDTRVIVMTPQSAALTAAGSWTQTDTAAVTTPTREFVWTAIWVLHEGEWKMQLVHMSFPAPWPGSR
jgi:ketosteroid isomerase-like protein